MWNGRIIWYNKKRKSNKKESSHEKSTDLAPMPPLEGDEEVKEGKELKILTPKKLLTRLPILLALIKAGNSLFIQIKIWNQTNTISLVSTQ